jgi:hypothetical protein
MTISDLIETISEKLKEPKKNVTPIVEGGSYFIEIPAP